VFLHIERLRSHTQVLALFFAGKSRGLSRMLFHSLVRSRAGLDSGAGFRS